MRADIEDWPAPWTSAGQHWLELQANTTSIVHSITSFLVLLKSLETNSRIVSLPAPPIEEVAKWIEHKAKQRSRVQIIKWNNDWPYERLSEMPDPIQEFMEEYIPQFVPLELRYHIDYFFDIYDAEEKRIRP